MLEDVKEASSVGQVPQRHTLILAFAEQIRDRCSTCAGVNVSLKRSHLVHVPRIVGASGDDCG